MQTAALDFGYPWWLSYGHLVPFAIALVIFAIARNRRWPMLLAAALGLWSVAAFGVTRFAINVADRGTLPTQAFLRGGSGKVLDMGAGTGRSSIMVLEARPQATLVAYDLFGRSFEQHFGPGPTPQQRLLANLKAAGVDGRASIETGDMRKLPFDADSFDAVVSAYAVDHLNREGMGQAISEAARVVKPGGDFLLILIANDAWAKFAFGPMLSHGRTRGTDWWGALVEYYGFEVVEKGSQPATQYLLARKR